MIDKSKPLRTRTQIAGTFVYVLGTQDGRLIRVVMPGDYMDITARLTPKQLLHARRVAQRAGTP